MGRAARARPGCAGSQAGALASAVQLWGNRKSALTTLGLTAARGGLTRGLARLRGIARAVCSAMYLRASGMFCFAAAAGPAGDCPKESGPRYTAITLLALGE